MMVCFDILVKKIMIKYYAIFSLSANLEAFFRFNEERDNEKNV